MISDLRRVGFAMALEQNSPAATGRRWNEIFDLFFAITFCVFATAASAKSIEDAIKQKSGAWETLKIVNSKPTPTADFGAAFPIGNGRLGAKIFGAADDETIPLNDTTLWSGTGPEHFENPVHQVVLVQLRTALADGDYVKADQLARQMEGRNNESYQPLADLHLRFPGHDAFTNYSNTLDLSRAVVRTRYVVTGKDGKKTTFTREAFASNPGKVIVVHLTSNRHGTLNFSAGLSTQLHFSQTTVAGNEMVITGRAPVHVDNYDKKGIVEWDPHGGMTMETRLHLQVKGGKMTADKDAFSVSGADDAVLIISAATSFNGFDRDPSTDGKDPTAIALKYMDAAVAKSYPQLLSEHLKDYEGLFRRLWVSINGEAANNKYVMAYQYARYALIAASRPGSGAPRNEQGIWNRDLTPQYASNFTLNENPEKYYSVAEVANIGQTTEPLIDFVGDLAKNGTITAKTDYGFHGWVAHHNADIWAMTTMSTGDPCWADWPVGGIRLTQTLWEHYAFSLDKDYLAKKAYPVMRGAAEFALDLLVYDKDGYLVSSPSTSPENHFLDPVTGKRVAVSQGSTMDMALIKQLLENTIQASEVLGIDVDFRSRLQATVPKLLPYKIGSQGQLQEWSEDFKEWEPTHRHVSHLVSVCPLAQITRTQRPDLFAAAKVSLDLRLSGGYHPDKAGMWARLGDGDKALNAFRDLSFPTKFDAPMGGFAEMLVQSQDGGIDLLPALPLTWESGEVRGIRARGGYEVDLSWKGHQLTSATIRSYAGGVPTVRLGGQAVNLGSDPRVQVVQIR